MTDDKNDHFEAGIATLSKDPQDQFPEDSPWTVSGVALPVNTIVNGGQDVDHFYPESVLEDSAELLEGKSIVKDFHSLDGQASASDVIGEVTSAGYQKGVGIVFEGEIVDSDIAQKVAQGYLDVSPTPARALGEYDDSMGGQRVERLVDFRDIAVVDNGQKGARVEMGSNPAVTALSRDALSRGFDTLSEGTEPDTGDSEGDNETPEEPEEPDEEETDDPDGHDNTVAVVETVPVEENPNEVTVIEK